MHAWAATSQWFACGRHNPTHTGQKPGCVGFPTCRVPTRLRCGSTRGKCPSQLLHSPWYAPPQISEKFERALRLIHFKKMAGKPTAVVMREPAGHICLLWVSSSSSRQPPVSHCHRRESFPVWAGAGTSPQRPRAKRRSAQLPCARAQHRNTRNTATTWLPNSDLSARSAFI